MDENERSEEIGEVVPPAEDGSAEQRESAPTPQSHEDNRRFQAARLGGERAGYERAMRELAGRESPSGARARKSRGALSPRTRASLPAGIRRRISRGWTLRRAFAVSAAAATAESR